MEQSARNCRYETIGESLNLWQTPFKALKNDLQGSIVSKTHSNFKDDGYRYPINSQHKVNFINLSKLYTIENTTLSLSLSLKNIETNTNHLLRMKYNTINVERQSTRRRETFRVPLVPIYFLSQVTGRTRLMIVFRGR